MNELGVRLTAEENKANKEWAEALFMGSAREKEMREGLTLKMLTRKCICCGAPGYEVDH